MTKAIKSTPSTRSAAAVSLKKKYEYLIKAIEHCEGLGMTVDVVVQTMDVGAQEGNYQAVSYTPPTPETEKY